MPTTALRTEADIVAAAAAFLGFAPTNSVVAYMLHRDTHTSDLVVRSAIRFDVTISAEQATNFPATCNLRPETNHAAVLLAVCDESYEWHAVTVLDALSDALRAAGIPVLRRLMTRDVTTEGQWYDPDTGATGPTPTLWSPRTGCSAVNESARRAATSKPNSRPCRQPRRSPSATTASLSSVPQQRSPPHSRDTRSVARYRPAPASPSPPTSPCVTP